MGESKHGVQRADSRSRKERAVSRRAIHAEEMVGAEVDDSSSSEYGDVLLSTTLDLSKHAMPLKEGLARTLSQFKHLQKLDMSSMESSQASPKGLDSLAWLEEATTRRKGEEEAFGDYMTWLKISDNVALGDQPDSHSWTGIENLTRLAVLNASSCALTCAPPASAFLRLSNLAALILAHNRLKTLSHLPYLPQLNTLVLSHNKIAQLPRNLAGNLPSLKKLSITHNALEWKDEISPLPNFSMCSHLREVRISGNQKLKKLPDHMSTWGRGEGSHKLGTGLETLEAADCGLDSWEDISAVMDMALASYASSKRQRGLSNLTLKGNGVAYFENYKVKLLEVHPTLRTFDGERMREVKTKENDAKITRGNTDTQQNVHIFDAKGDATRAKEKGNDKTEDNLKNTKERLTRSNESGEKTKLRKRGRRGGTSKETLGEPSLKRDEKLLNGLQGGKGKETVIPKSSNEHDRATRRAGPEPPTEVKKRKKESKEDESDRGGVRIKKERKAWDETETSKPQADVEREVVPSISAQRNGKALTSVAAVVKMKRKGQQAQHTKPKEVIWGKLNQKEEILGTGLGWM